MLYWIYFWNDKKLLHLKKHLILLQSASALIIPLLRFFNFTCFCDHIGHAHAVNKTSIVHSVIILSTHVKQH